MGNGPVSMSFQFMAIFLLVAVALSLEMYGAAAAEKRSG